MTNYEKLKNNVDLEYKIFKSNMLKSPPIEIFDAAIRIRDYTNISRILVAEGYYNEDICDTLCSCNNLIETIFYKLPNDIELNDDIVSDVILNFAVEIRRDRVEYEKNLWERIAVDFMRLAKSDGYTVTPSDSPALYAHISLHGGFPVPFDRGNHLHFENDVLDQRLMDLMHDVKSYAFAAEHWMPDMPEYGPAKDYKQLCDFGSTVLTAKYEPDYGYRFATWKYGLDKDTLYNRKDFTDYRQAYKDFVLRSVLIDERDFFTPEELKCLHAACCYHGANDENLTVAKVKELDALIGKIEASLPEIPEPDNELSEESEIEP